jgi:hypothetical protein
MLFMNFGAKKFDRYILPVYLAAGDWSPAVAWLAA